MSFFHQQHITRLSVLEEEIPLVPLKFGQSQKSVSGKSVEQQSGEEAPEQSNDEEVGGPLRKDIPLTESQEFMLDTKI